MQSGLSWQPNRPSRCAPAYTYKSTSHLKETSVNILDQRMCNLVLGFSSNSTTIEDVFCAEREKRTRLVTMFQVSDCVTYLTFVYEFVRPKDSKRECVFLSRQKWTVFGSFQWDFSFCSTLVSSIDNVKLFAPQFVLQSLEVRREEINQSLRFSWRLKAEPPWYSIASHQHHHLRKETKILSFFIAEPIIVCKLLEIWGMTRFNYLRVKLAKHKTLPM